MVLLEINRKYNFKLYAQKTDSLHVNTLKSGRMLKWKATFFKNVFFSFPALLTPRPCSNRPGYINFQQTSFQFLPISVFSVGKITRQFIYFSLPFIDMYF